MHLKNGPAMLFTIGVAAISLLAAACSGSATPTSPSAGGAEPGKPRYGGVMNVVMANPSDRMNPFAPTAAVSANVIHEPFMEGLLEYNPDKPSEIIPALAESWSSPDGQNYTFKLRKDVTWHDGKPFTAADVINTFNHYAYMDTLNKSARQGKFLKDFGATWSAPDPSTVVVNLSAPNVGFLRWVADAGQMIGAKHINEKYGGPKKDLSQEVPKNEDVIGTGPYKFVKHDRDVETILERNPNYWKKDAAGNQLPFMDGLHVYLVRDTALQFAAFRTNQVDMWPSGYPIVLKSEAEALRNALGDKVSITFGNSGVHEHFYLANRNGLMKERDFRYALHLITDRQEIARRAAEGSFVLGITDPSFHGDAALPMEELLKLPGWRQPKTQDFDEARKLLAKLGVTPQTPVTLVHPVRNYGSTLAQAQVWARQTEPFGIKQKVNAMENAAVSPALASGNWDVNSDLDTMPSLDPYSVLAQQLDWGKECPGGSGSGYCIWDANEVSVQNAAKVHQMLVEAARTVDEKKRNELYREVQRFVYTVDTPNIITGFDGTHYMWWNVVKGYKTIGGANEGLRYDRAWLER